MDASERAWLLMHLHDQAATLLKMADEAKRDVASEERLIAIRDQVFVIKETLGTLEVPHALASRDEWSRAIGSDDGSS
ncbi:MAG: hypothetical protein WC558_10155 [Patulibacter sp.]